MNADGSGQRNLTRNAAFDADPAWSPDGRSIAFRSTRDGNPEVYIMKADGSGQRNLTRSPRERRLVCLVARAEEIAEAAMKSRILTIVAGLFVALAVPTAGATAIAQAPPEQPARQAPFPSTSSSKPTSTSLTRWRCCTCLAALT